jgi:hypothetical protein
VSRRDGWLLGGEPARRCGRLFKLPTGKHTRCTAPVFVLHLQSIWAPKLGIAGARYVCVEKRCTRYDEATALRYNR